MSVEEQQSTGEQSDTYVGVFDGFASEIGSTLKDLVSDWNESDYDSDARLSVGNVQRQNLQTDSSRTPSFKIRASMEDGMTDLSLKKARPLAFANPVYDLANLGGVATKSRQMTLIPLSQFDINNKSHDESTKHGKQKHGKRASHGFINKLSHLTKKKHHSVRKHEPEMDVTSPLWTDHAAVSYREEPKRSMSLHRTPSSDSGQENARKLDENQPRRLSLELEKIVEKETMKLPPTKLPRNSKGSFSPVEEIPITNQPDNVVISKVAPVSQGGLELPENKQMRSMGSTTSLASDISEQEAIEENTKTMMEVMHEIQDDSANEEETVSQQKEEKVIEDDATSLKRNKTLKWSGSRAAPALIREFTRKSKKSASARQADTVSTDSPDTYDSPVKKTKDIAQHSSDITQHQTDENKSRVDKLQTNGSKSSSGPTTPRMRDASAFTVLSSLLPPAPKLRRTESTKIRMYIHKMGTNAQNALGYATTQFVEQTIHSSEHRPVVLLHSIRSFLTDIKKYLISNPHVGFMTKIQKIVKHTHITDVEGAIDDALERLVLYPLRDYIYKRLVIDYARTGKIRMVEDSIKVGKTKSQEELGIRSTLIPPDEESLETVRHHFIELQATYSPYYKLKHLLSAVTTIYQNTSDLTCEDKSARKIGADDFLPLLVHAIIKCDFSAADIEAQYIDGLLDPTLLLGEGGYYLTTLISAVQVLSSMKKRETPLPNISDLQGFLKVGISSKADKLVDSENKQQQESDTDASNETLLLHKTLHVPPSMTAQNLGLMIAKKYGVKNTKDFCLHVVVNGVAYPLKPQEFPQLVKMDLLTQFQAKCFYFVYRQIDKTPEKVMERPVTMDTEHLKVNTEEGGEAEIVSEKEVVSDEEIKEDSGSGKESSNGETSIDDLPPPSDFHDNISSPGFADMPLPEAFFKDDIMLQSPDAMPLPQKAMPPPPDAMPPPPDVMPPPPDDIPPPPDAMVSAADVMPPPPATMPPPPDTTQSLSEVTIPEFTPMPSQPDTTQPIYDGTLPSPSIEDTPPSPDPTLPTPDTTIPLQDTTHPPLFNTVSQPEDTLTQDATLPPPDATLLSSGATLPPPDITLPPPDMILSPPNAALPPLDATLHVQDATLPPPDDILPPPDAALSQNINNIPPLSSEDLPNPDKNSQHSSDTTETDTSDDDIHIYEFYQSATLVDDILSQAKQSRPKPPRQKKNVATLQPLVQEKNIPHPEDDSSTKIHKDSQIREKPKNYSTQPSDIPSVTLTDVSEGAAREIDTLSDVSSASDGRHSVGCHSDSYSVIGSHGDGRHSSRGYHSDGHQVDETPHSPKETDSGTHTNVSALKNYFESEISKVTPDTARAGPPQSPL